MNSPFERLNETAMRRERVEMAERVMRKVCTALLLFVMAAGTVLALHHAWAIRFPLI